MDRFTLAITIEIIAIFVFITGLVLMIFAANPISTILITTGAVFLAIGSLLFFKIFRKTVKL